MLESIIGAPPRHPLFDTDAVIGLFKPGEHWTLRTTKDAEGNTHSFILFRGKEYPIDENKVSTLLEVFLESKHHTLEYAMKRDKPTLDTQPGTKKYKKEVAKRYMFGEYVKFLAEDSDKLAKELKDPESPTLSRQAAQLASSIQKEISDFSTLPFPYGDSKKQFSANIGIIESFLIQCIRKTSLVDTEQPPTIETNPLPSTIKGKELNKEEKLVEILENGLEESDKLNVHLKKNRANEVKIMLSFYKEVSATGKKFILEREVSPKILEAIISERLVIS